MMRNMPKNDLNMVTIDLVDDCDDFVRTDTPKQYNGPKNCHKPNVDRKSVSLKMENEQKSLEKHSGLVIARVEGAKGWLEEMIDFSATLARQTQSTLGHIKSDFLQSGMKFDADFRDHFLYIANNRLKESFDAFLIGLPSDMKATSCPINRFAPQKSISRSPDHYSQPISVPAKRPRLNDYSRESMTSPNVTSRSNQSLESLKRDVGIGREINIHKIVATRKTETSSSLSVTKSAKGQGDKISGITTTKEVQKFANSTLRSEIPVQQKDRKKSLENARNLTNFHMYLAENKLSSPTNPERRMSLGGPLIAHSHVHTKSDVLNKSTTEKVAKPTELKGGVAKSTEPTGDCVEKPKAKRVYTRRMTVASKEFTTNSATKTSHTATAQAPSDQLNVTLPAARRTRSRSAYPIESTYQCEFCSYSNSNKTNYLRHRLIHTGEQPFKCKHCDKGFTQKINLVTHLRRYHQELRSHPSYWDLS